ncbi:hypothetical protein PIB30_103959 [Stylosanthes scabra]|uniref:Uncharacterized protein n=1 Tax=Stylosanthes scabra TaxID=79078 RepID=A0ABU6UZC8_9FABA|nr:hypothetical protein [Stylosanthes scabra]
MQLQQQQFFENMRSTQAQYLEELKIVKPRKNEERKLEEQEAKNLEHSGQSPHA